MMPPQCQLTYQPVFRSPIIPVCTLTPDIYASQISDHVQFQIKFVCS